MCIRDREEDAAVKLQVQRAWQALRVRGASPWSWTASGRATLNRGSEADLCRADDDRVFFAQTLRAPNL
eukprot:3092141-Prymnesium_polylepis.1